jgi:hypothetical protein
LLSALGAAIICAIWFLKSDVSDIKNQSSQSALETVLDLTSEAQGVSLRNKRSSEGY